MIRPASAIRVALVRPGDVGMPDGVNGLELAERLRRDKPDLPVVFASGSGPRRSK